MITKIIILTLAYMALIFLVCKFLRVGMGPDHDFDAFVDDGPTNKDLDE